MDTLDLARLQFIGTTGLHWLFVIFSLGLAPLVAVVHTRAVLARDPGRRAGLMRMTRFWGQLYVINYAIGIVTGLIVEFQLGLSWSGLSKFAGNVIGAPLALEALVAFFAESTFLGMWIFGWGRLRPAVHAGLIWLVTLTAYASAYWILVVNGFMQVPTGLEVRDGVAYLADFGALLTNSNVILALIHVTSAALVAGGLFLAGVSAYHLRRGTADREPFLGSLRMGVAVAAVAVIPTAVVGNMQFPILQEMQPMKVALFTHAPTDALQARMRAAYGPGDYVPPYWAEIGEEVMLYLGYTLGMGAICALLMVFRETLVRRRAVAAVAALAAGSSMGEFAGGLVFGAPGPHRVAVYVACTVLAAALLVFRPRRRRALALLLVVAIPLPFVASLAGWVMREVGRQPWLVYGHLKVEDGLSPVGWGMMLASTVTFIAVLAGLAVADWVLITVFARRGPDGAHLGAVATAPEPEPEPVKLPL
ncbi:cytochrome ubiquinol oxidase subunit I [Streptosporangium sp. NPDC023615]|uniref:cytochrome ubiquinol oxidase subunit I n=1 Tax=Streptosporangium sp. NPDC023615 TaxID=3154794 RepID=UPI00342182E4